MKFIADESVEFRFVSELRKQEYDIVSVSEEYSGIIDSEVLTMAFNQKRILITNEKDFGDLVYRLKLPHKGIILFRLAEETYLSKLLKFKQIINKHKSKLPDSFTVVTSKKIRIRKSGHLK